MTKPLPKNRLSLAGRKAEAMLATILKDMEADARKHTEAKDRVYSLTDAMKVIDRVAKFEAISARIKDDEEGSFFTNRNDDPDEERADDEQDDAPERLTHT